MGIYTKAKVSPKGKVNREDLLKWGHNLLVFLAPLGIVYLLQLHGVLQNGGLTLDDLKPTQATQGAMMLYIINAVLDFLRKFTDGKK